MWIYPKKVKLGAVVVWDKKANIFLNLLIPPYLFQLHRKHKKNSILIQNTNNFVGKYLKVIEIFTKKLNTSIWHYTDVKRKHFQNRAQRLGSTSI